MQTTEIPNLNMASHHHRQTNPSNKLKDQALCKMIMKWEFQIHKMLPITINHNLAKPLHCFLNR